jgi:hypothetical protein
VFLVYLRIVSIENELKEKEKIGSVLNKNGNDKEVGCDVNLRSLCLLKVCIYECNYMYIYTSTYVYMFMCVYTFIYVNIYMYMYVYV